MAFILAKLNENLVGFVRTNFLGLEPFLYLLLDLPPQRHVVIAFPTAGSPILQSTIEVFCAEKMTMTGEPHLVVMFPVVGGRALSEGEGEGMWVVNYGKLLDGIGEVVAGINEWRGFSVLEEAGDDGLRGDEGDDPGVE